MAQLFHLSSSNVSDTFHKLLQTEGGKLADASGSTIKLLYVTASHAISASHEITLETRATNADNIDINTTSANADYRLTMVDQAGTGYEQLYVDNISHNPSTDTTTISTIEGVGATYTTVNATQVKISGQNAALDVSPDNVNTMFVGSSNAYGFNIGHAEFFSRTGFQLYAAGSEIFNIDFRGNVSASGFISASSYMDASEYYLKSTKLIDRSGNQLRIDEAGAYDSYVIGRGNQIKAISLSGNVTSSGNLTVDGNISGSGNITTDKIYFRAQDTTANYLEHNGSGLHFKGTAHINGHLTASGNIHATSQVSASDIFTHNKLYSNNKGLALYGSAATIQIISGSGKTIYSSPQHVFQNSNLYSMGNPEYMRIDGDTNIVGHVTASGNISASSTSGIHAARFYQNGNLINNIFSPIAGGTGIVTVGALNAGSITSGFTSIDVGSGFVSGSDIKGISGSFDAVNTTGDISASGKITAAEYKGVPVVLANMSEYLASATSGERWYYGNNTQGWHHTMNNYISVAPETGVDTSINQGGQHNSFIVPFDVKDIEFRCSIRLNKNNSQGKFWISKKPRQDGGAAFDDNFLFMASASTVDNATMGLSRFYNCDITGSHAYVSNMTASAGDEIWIFYNPAKVNNNTDGSENTPQKWTWTLSARTNE